MKLEFPRYVVKVEHGKLSHLLTHDEVEHSEAIKAGWFHDYASAIAPKDEPKAKQELEPEDNSAPTREEIEAKCAELGIPVDGRMKDATLLKKIEDAISGKAE
jgi:hypothetical protein